MKREYRKSPHVVYDIKYHFVFCPKYRYRVLKGELKRRVQLRICEICEELDILMVEGEICEDHIHMCLSVPPKYSASYVMKKIKGKTAEMVFREFPEIKKRYWGQHFWSRGYFVSTVGIDEETIKKYIQNQNSPSTEEQMKLWK